MLSEISQLILSDGTIVKDAKLAEQQLGPNDLVFDHIKAQLSVSGGAFLYRCYRHGYFIDLNAAAVVWVYYHKEE